MPSGIFHLTLTDNFPSNFCIEQGATFNWFVLVMEGNFTQWTPRGQIRDKYASDSGVIKATFAFDPLVIGDMDLPDGTTISGTIIKPKLTGAQTQALNWLESKMVPRQTMKDKAIAGKNVWVYDIEIESTGGEIVRVISGFVEVSPEATR